MIVAASFEQARIAFDHIVAFLAGKLRDKPTWRVWDSPQQARIENRATGAKVRCIGSDPRRAHGLAPVLVLADEPAQWGPSGDRMIAAMTTALGKIPNSRLVALGTRPASSEHWFAKLLAGGADFAQSHAALLDDPPFRRRTWAKANPSMAHMPDLAGAIEREAKAASRDDSMLAGFRALRLNLGTADVMQSTLLDASTWGEIERDADMDGPCFWGLDLGTNAAMSAVAAYWPMTGRLEVVAAFPLEPSLAERGLFDGVGGLYVQCAERGELQLFGTRAVELGPLFGFACRKFGAPAGIAADRWRYSEAADALNGAGVPLSEFTPRGQGFKDGAEDVRAFRRACLEGKVAPVESLLMRSAMAEARVVMDAAGNAKLAKSVEAQRRARARDDAAAAAILAVSLGARVDVAPRRRVRSAIV